VFLTAVFVLGAISMNAQTKVYVHKTDGSAVSFNVGEVESINFLPPTLPDHVTPVNITDDKLQNAYKEVGKPFVTGELAPVPNNTDRYYQLAGWTANDDCLANGNLDYNGLFSYMADGAIGIFQAQDSPVPVVNGKLYQTIQLDPGYYELKVNYIESQSVATAYVVANVGTDLPDLDKVEADATAFLSIPMYKGLAWDDPMLSIKFTITATSDVSLGFVGSCAGGRVMFSRVELWQE